MTIEKRSVSLLATTLSLLILAGCGSEESDVAWAGTVTDSAGVQIVTNAVAGLWGEGEGWQVEEVLSIGEMAGAEEYQFGQIIGVDVDADGNVYVADTQASDIRVYDAMGTYLRTIGQPGAGPGEIGLGLSAVFVVGEEVLAPNIGNARINRYDRKGESIGSFPMDILKGVPVRWDRIGDRVIAQLRSVNVEEDAAPTGDIVVSMGDPELPRDTIAMLPVGQSMQFTGGQPRARIFAPEPIWDAGADGRVIMGVNDALHVEVRNASGLLERIITRPFEVKPVTDRDKRVFLDAIGEAARLQGAPPAAINQFLEAVEFADNYPAFATMNVGPEGSTWIQRIRSGDEIGGEEDFDAQDVGSPTWDVYDDQGRYLGPVTFPGKYQPIKVQGDLIYGIARDELDVQRMKVYRVVM